MQRQLILLIAAATALRLALAAATGLGVDESYMVSSGRDLSLGYFDHPPASWWLSWTAAHLAGSEAPIVVRLPFIVLFAMTTWLMYRLGETVAGPRAGYWAAATLNLSPVFGITTGTWVLPDGPLDCALTGAALCLMRALPARGRTGAGNWCGAGACAGVALFSKYSAVLTIAGVLMFLIADREHRPWLRRWEPYAAGAIALLVFSPVVIWNFTHDWASFAFQGARAGGMQFRPIAPVTTLLGEALFVLPWFWLPMLVLGWRAFRSGWRARLLAWLAVPPIVVFALVSAWSSQRVLYHWAAPGYLMLFPLVGRYVATHWDRRVVRGFVTGTAMLSIVSVAVIGSQIQFGWLPYLNNATAEGLDWTSLRDDLSARGLLRAGTIVGVPNWRDAGKIAHALGPDVTVLCLNRDCRQFGFADQPARWAGSDVLLLAADHAETAIPALNDLFESIETLPPSAVSLRGRLLKSVAVALGKKLTAPLVEKR